MIDVLVWRLLDPRNLALIPAAVALFAAGRHLTKTTPKEGER